MWEKMSNQYSYYGLLIFIFKLDLRKMFLDLRRDFIFKLFIKVFMELKYFFWEQYSEEVKNIGFGCLG